MPALNELASASFNDTVTYSDVVHFVHIYVIEPHPQSPDLSPYSGRVNERAYSSGKSQPLTYEERLAHAKEMQMLIQGDQLLLIDDLTPVARNNPLWCTYGPAPNSAYLIRRDGILQLAQNWVDVSAMKQAIQSLLE